MSNINETAMDTTIAELIGRDTDVIDIQEESYSIGFERAFELADPDILHVTHSYLGISDEIIQTMIELDLEDQLFILLTRKLRGRIKIMYPDTSYDNLLLIERIAYPKVHDSLMRYLSSEWEGSKYYTKKDEDEYI